MNRRTISIPDELWNAAKEKAGLTSLSAIIRILLQKWVDGEIDLENGLTHHEKSVNIHSSDVGKYSISDVIGSQKAAALLGVTQGWIPTLVRQGKIVGHKIGKQWAINRQSVLEYAQTISTTDQRNSEMVMELINTQEAAEILDVTSAYVTVLINESRFAAAKFGKQWVIDRQSVLAYKEARDNAQE